MKKSICLLLLFALMLSLAACGRAAAPAPTPGADAFAPDFGADQPQDVALSEGTDDEQGLPEFDYRLAVVGDITVDGVRRVSYAFECLTDGYAVFDAVPLRVSDDMRPDADRRSYSGWVCPDGEPHGLTVFGGDVSTDRSMTVMLLMPREDMAPEDIYLSVRLEYSDGSRHVWLDAQRFDINADISEISVPRGFIHGSTLVRFRDGYYVFDSQSVGVSVDDDRQLVGVPLRLLSGNPADDFGGYLRRTELYMVDEHIEQEGVLSTVYYVNDGYEPYAMPDGVAGTTEYRVAEEMLYWGVEGVDGHVLTDDERGLAHDLMPVFVDDAGNRFIYAEPHPRG